MAKDFDQDLDNLEDFEDLDFSDLDFDDEGGGLAVEDGIGRTPVQKAVHRTYNAAVEEIKSRRIRDHGLGVIENSLSQDGKIAFNDLKFKIKDGVDEATKAFKPLKDSLTTLTKGLKEITPAGGRLNTFFTNMSQKLANEDATSEAISQQQEQLASFQSEVQESFSNINQQLQAVISQAQKSGGMGSLLQQNNAIQNLIKEQNRIYYTKSLELQWRIAHATEESNTLAREQFEAYTKIFNTIVHNTSLPEAVKVTNMEMAMVNLKNRAFNTLNDTLFKQVLPIDKIQKNLMIKLKEKIADFTDNVSSANDFLDIGKDLKDSGLTPEDMLGSQLGSYALDKVYSGVSKFIPRKYRGRFEQGIMGLLADPIAYLKTQRVKDPDGIIGKLFNKAVGGLTELVGNTNLEANRIKLSNTDLNMQAIFDGRTHNSINVVIPRLLSKIHSEVYGLRTGKDITADDELRYNIESGDFVTTKEATVSLQRDVKKFTIDVARKSAQGIAKHVEDVLSNVNTKDKTVKARVMKHLSKAILAYTTSYGAITPDALLSTEFLAYYPPDLQLEAADLFQEFMRDIRNYNKLSSTYSMFRTASSMLNVSPQMLQQRAVGMDRDIVKRMGLIDVNKYTGESHISAKGYQNLINKRYGIEKHAVNSRIGNDFAYESDIDWAEDTKATLTAAADYIKEIGKDKPEETDYFSDGGKYKGEFGTDIIRLANQMTEDELLNSEIAIKKEMELNEFINTDEMVKLRETNPDEYNKQVKSYKEKIDKKYDRSIPGILKKAANKVKSVFTGVVENEDGSFKNPKEAAEAAYEKAIESSEVLKKTDTVIKKGLKKGTEELNKVKKNLQETEGYKKAAETVNETVKAIKKSKAYKEVEEKVKDLAEDVKDAFSKKQNELIKFIDKNVVSKEQREAAVAYVKSLNKEELEKLYENTKKNIKAKGKAAVEEGRDITADALMAMAGDEEAKERLKEKGKQVKKSGEEIIDKANKGFKKAKSKGKEIASEAAKVGKKVTKKVKKDLKEKGVDVDKIADKVTKTLKPKKNKKVNDDKKDENTDKPYTEGQSLLNISTPEPISKGIRKTKSKKKRKKKSNRSMNTSGKRFMKIYTTDQGSIMSIREDIPIGASRDNNSLKSLWDNIKQSPDKLKENAKEASNKITNIFDKFKNAGPMSLDNIKGLREQLQFLTKEGVDTKDLTKKYREELKKSMLVKIKKNNDKLIKSGAMTAKDAKAILETAENIDLEKLKDPFYVFTLFKGLGGMTKYSLELGWEIGKTALGAYPKFFKSGFAKNMRAKEREFYKGVWQRIKKPFKKKDEKDLTPEERAKRRKGSWWSRLKKKTGITTKKYTGKLKKKGLGFIDKLKGLLKPLLFLVPPLLGKIWNFFKPLGPIFKGIWEGIKFIGKGVGYIGGLLGKIVGGLFGGAKKVYEGAKNLGGKVVDFFKGKKTVEAANKAGKTMKTIANAAKGGEVIAKGAKAAEVAGKATTIVGKVSEAAGKLTKSSIIKRIIAIAKTFKTFIVKRLGKTASTSVLAMLSSKMAARLVPVAGAALLAWDAGWIIKYMTTDGLSLKSAISKQLLGFDLFDDSDAAVDENGNPIKPDEPNGDTKEDLAKKEEEKRDKVEFNKFTINATSEDGQSSIHLSQRDLKVSKNADETMYNLLMEERKKYLNKKGKLTGSDKLHRDFMIAIRLLKKEDRNVDLETLDITGVSRKYGEYRLATYTIGEPDPDVVWTINVTDEITIGRMRRSWYQFGFGSKDVFEPLNLKDYIEDMKKIANGKGLMKGDDPNFKRKYLIYLGFKIKMIKEEIIKKAKKMESRSFDSALAYIEGKDHSHAVGGKITEQQAKENKANDTASKQDNTAKATTNDNKTQTEINKEHIKKGTVPVKPANNPDYQGVPDRPNIPGRTVPAGTSEKAIKAAEFVAKNAKGKSVGKCARYVANGLEAAGYKFERQPSAYMYASNGIMSKMGFTQIDNNTPPQIGDVLVFPKSDKTPHGHIQIYDGEVYNSDFKQNGGARNRKWNSPGPKYNGLVPTMWRDLSAVKKQEPAKENKANDAANDKVDNVPDDKVKSNVQQDSNQNHVFNNEYFEQKRKDTITAAKDFAMDPNIVAPKYGESKLGTSGSAGEDAAIKGVATAINDGNKMQGSQLTQLEMINKNMLELIQVMSKEQPKPSDRVQDLRKEQAKQTNPPISNTKPGNNKSEGNISPFDKRLQAPFSVAG